jgi:hypothetical protein
MIHEQLQWVTKREVILNVIVSVIASALLYLVHLFYDPSTVFMASIALHVAGINLVVYLSRKVGLASLYMILVSIITITLTDIGIVGFPKIVVFFVSSLIFEFAYLFFKIHFHNIPLDIVLGTSIGMASIPFTTALFISLNITSFPLSLLNLVLLSFAVGLGTSVIIFLLWHNIEKTKIIIKLQSYLQSLTRKL